jgi:hypothetical protein
MANILGTDRQQQILALGRLGWPLRRIEQATGVRRETASAYLKAAGIAIRGPRRRRPPNPASPVSTDPANPASGVSTDPAALPPGLGDPSPWPPPASRAPTASACEPYRELIELALGAYSGDPDRAVRAIVITHSADRDRSSERQRRRAIVSSL